MILRPSDVASDILRSASIVSGCIAFTIAFHTTGKPQSFAMTYGIFAMSSTLLGVCPDSLGVWIYENIVHDGPETVPVANGYGYVLQRTINSWFAILVGIFAASLASSITLRSKSG